MDIHYGQKVTSIHSTQSTKNNIFPFYYLFFAFCQDVVVFLVGIRQAAFVGWKSVILTHKAQGIKSEIQRKRNWKDFFH